MTKIYKYSLNTVDKQLVKMPVGAKILTVRIQSNKICMWAEVNRLEIGERLIFCYGTGFDIHGFAEYIATVQLGPLVWHFYDTGYVA